MGVIIDTSAIVQLEREQASWDRLIEASGDEPVFVPAIVWGELMAGVHLADTVDRALKRKAKLDRLAGQVPILPFTSAIAALWAELFSELQKKGTPVPSNDLCVISTAVHHGHSILVSSRDEQHFRRVERAVVTTL